MSFINFLSSLLFGKQKTPAEKTRTPFSVPTDSIAQAIVENKQASDEQMWEELENNKNAVVYSETFIIRPAYKPTLLEKYGYDTPMIIKMENLLDPKDKKMFVSPKDFCETLGIKPKKLYNVLESENKIFNGKYKLNIISFPIDNTSNAKTALDSETKLKIRVDNMKKRKFVSIKDKTPLLVKEWDEVTNGISADKVPHAIKENASWICPYCGVRYERRIDDRTRRPEPGCTKCFVSKAMLKK